MTPIGNISDVVLKYKKLKLEVLPHAATSVAASTRKEMKNMRDGLWQAIANAGRNDQTIVFSSPEELCGVITMLQDTGKIFGVDWKRRTTSKSDPTKVAGSLCTLTLKKVDGYVKGTSGGKKAVEDILAERITVWVCDGTLHTDHKDQNPGYGNWRTLYATDIKGIRLNGYVTKVEVA